MKDYLIEDIIRCLTMGMSFGILYFAISIILKYSKVIKIRKGVGKKIPMHIIEIGISYSLSILFICCTIGIRFGHPISWPTVLAIPIMIIGIHALWIMRSSLHDELSYPYR